MSEGNVFAEDMCVLSFARMSGSHAFSLPYRPHLQCASAKRSTSLFQEISDTRSDFPSQL